MSKLRTTIITLAAVLSGAVFMGVSSQQTKAADCSSVGDDSIEDANIANLEQLKENAEQMAASARTPQEQRRWQQTARMLSIQLETARRNQTSLSRGARQLCNLLTKDKEDRDDENDTGR